MKSVKEKMKELEKEQNFINFFGMDAMGEIEQLSEEIKELKEKESTIGFLNRRVKEIKQEELSKYEEIKNRG